MHVVCEERPTTKGSKYPNKKNARTYELLNKPKFP